MPSKANQKCSNIFFSRKKPGWRPHFTVINRKFPWLGFLTPSLISFNIQMEGGTGSPLINWKAFAWFATHYTGPYTAASVFYLGVNLITKTMTSVWSLQRWPNPVLGHCLKYLLVPLSPEAAKEVEIVLGRFLLDVELFTSEHRYGVCFWYL